MALREYLAVYVNLCWAFGQLISAGVSLHSQAAPHNGRTAFLRDPVGMASPSVLNTILCSGVSLALRP